MAQKVVLGHAEFGLHKGRVYRLSTGMFLPAICFVSSIREA